MTTITLPRAVVEQALEALERARPLKADYTTLEYLEEAKRKHYAAMAAFRAALAQQAEPVDTDCHTQGICQRSGYGITQQAEPVEPVACANMEPSSAQLKSILDGLARCHVEQSASEFLRAWIRDWTAHKVYAPPQRAEPEKCRLELWAGGGGGGTQGRAEIVTLPRHSEPNADGEKT